MDVIGLVLLLALAVCCPAVLVAWVLVNRMQSVLGEGSFWETFLDLTLRDAPGLIRSVSEVSQRVELALHRQAVTIGGRATAVQAVTIRAHPTDCDRLAASLDLPHLLRTYAQGYLRNAVSEGWQVIAPQVTIALVADERRRRGWPRVLAGRALAGDTVVAAASVTLSGDHELGAPTSVDGDPSAARPLFDRARTRPYQPPTLRQGDTLTDAAPARHGSACPAEHLTTLVDRGGRKVRLGGLAVLGRSKGAHVRTDDPAVSREHALIEHDQGGWSITPTSRNGTLVDGTACTTRTPLRTGAVIKLSGRASWTFTTDCPQAHPLPLPATLRLA